MRAAAVGDRELPRALDRRCRVCRPGRSGRGWCGSPAIAPGRRAAARVAARGTRSRAALFAREDAPGVPRRLRRDPDFAAGDPVAGASPLRACGDVRMKFVLFYHSFVSCWNHGNAHFLRGVARELLRLGHEVHVYEPEAGWSRTNALRDAGAPALEEAASLVPGVELHTYRDERLDLDAALDRADAVIVHEW